MHSRSTMARDLAADIHQARSVLKLARAGSQAAWTDVLDFAGFWSLRHEGLHSVLEMDLGALQQSVVEDVLLATVEQGHGAYGVYPVSQLFRHLGALPIVQRHREETRIRRVLARALDGGLVAELPGGSLQVPPDKISQAERYCGVFHGHDEEEEDSDWVDTMVSAGGLELLTDALEDLACQLD